MSAPAVEHALVLLETGRPQMAAAVLRQLAEAPPQSLPVALGAEELICELRGQLMAARHDLAELGRRLAAAEADLSKAQLEVARLKRGQTRQSQEKKHERLARLLNSGSVSAADVAAVLRCPERAVPTIAAGSLGLVPTSWQRLWVAPDGGERT